MSGGSGGTGAGGAHAVTQHCPYCGGTDLRPHEASHGAWGCRECRRVFAVRMLGLLPPPVPHGPVRPGPSEERA